MMMDTPGGGAASEAAVGKMLQYASMHSYASAVGSSICMCVCLSICLSVYLYVCLGVSRSS